MKSILSTIKQLRKEETLKIDYSNNNRYRVIVHENNGSKTAYCFSAPIYNVDSRKAVDLQFHEKDHAFYAEGSNAKISIAEKLRLENAEGVCTMKLKALPQFVSPQELICNRDRIFPALNGVVYEACLKGNAAFSFEIETEKPLSRVRTNEKYFALMSSRFRPFVSISCIGAVNGKNDEIVPAKVTYEKLTDRRYQITVAPHHLPADSVLFEINLYEPKLIQDTTVESLHPKRNNAFGSIAFIGETDDFGEQWLYFRPEFTNIIDMMSKNVSSVIIHFPKHNSSKLRIDAYKAARRFCSFGSKWKNKVPVAEFMDHLKENGDYLDLDATKWLVKPWSNHLTATPGFILKPKLQNAMFSVLSTGDSYDTPVIMEIRYKG